MSGLYDAWQVSGEVLEELWVRLVLAFVALILGMHLGSLAAVGELAGWSPLGALTLFSLSLMLCMGSPIMLLVQLAVLTTLVALIRTESTRRVIACLAMICLLKSIAGYRVLTAFSGA